jgi:hypothetical protein
LSEPRAAFYTDNGGKMQNKNARSSTTVRKNCQALSRAVKTYLKKNWKWGEHLT